MMKTSDLDNRTWQELLASLTGNAVTDAVLVRAFCFTHGITPPEVMAEMHKRREKKE
jgi:hypothetical protein